MSRVPTWPDFFALQLEPSLLGFEIARDRNLLGRSTLTSTAVPEPFCKSVGDPSTAQLLVKVFVCLKIFIGPLCGHLGFPLFVKIFCYFCHQNAARYQPNNVFGNRVLLISCLVEC